MKVEIIQRGPMLVAGLARPFIQGLSPRTNAPQVIGRLWGEFHAMHRQIGHRVGDMMYGVMYDPDPAQRTDPEELIYLACVEVSSAAALPAGAVSREVPGGTFARIVHRGPITEITNTLRYLYRDWLPASDWQHSDQVDIEAYGHDWAHDGEDSEMDYLISVMPRGK